MRTEGAETCKRKWKGGDGQTDRQTDRQTDKGGEGGESRSLTGWLDWGIPSGYGLAD